MLLPIPAVSGSMTQSNIVDTTSAPHFLEDMEKTKPVPRSVSKGPVSQGIIAIFNHDIYTIVLANDASAIPAALKQVPEDRRPAMNPEIFEAYGKWYKGWTFALCCFNNKEAQKAKPMLWWYEPNDPKHLFFPALDAHTGQAPVMNTMVDVDHTLFFSTLALKDAPQVQYSDRNIDPKLKELLPPKVMLNEYNGKMKQGDFRINVADLNKDKMEVMRTIPLGNGNFKDIGRAWDLLTVSTEPSRTLAPTRISGPESDYEAPVLKKTPSRSKTPKNAELHGPG